MDLIEYFGLEHGWEVKWAHGVNSKYLLQKAIKGEFSRMETKV